MRGSRRWTKSQRISWLSCDDIARPEDGRRRSIVDRGVSGSKDRRPALDELVAAAKRRTFDVVVCWRLDRLGRNLRHLVVLLDELNAMGVSFVSLNEGIDLMTPAGRLQLHILASLSEFERARIQERVRAGLARVRAQGRRLGRKPCAVSDEQFAGRRESLHAAGRPAPRRLSYGGRPLARCKQDPSGSDHGNPRFPGLRVAPDRCNRITSQVSRWPTNSWAALKSVNIGDAVRHSAKPEWGAGEAVAGTADRIEVRFAYGVVRLNPGMRRHRLQG